MKQNKDKNKKCNIYTEITNTVFNKKKSTNDFF